MKKLRTGKWLSLPKRAMRQAQADKLRTYLERVVIPFSAHYRDLFREHRIHPASIRTIEDLRRIPFTTKSDLPNRTQDFILIPDQKVLARRPSTITHALIHGRAATQQMFEREFRPLMLTSTTGRSADPVAFVYTEHDIDNLTLAGRRVMRVCGAKHDMRMINMFPFAPHLGFWQVHYAGVGFGVFVLSSGGGKVMGTDGNLRLIRKIQPDVLIGMPTFMYHVLHEAVQEGVRCPNLVKIVLGGEKAPAGIRRKLRSLARELGAAQVDVLLTYGFTEAKMAWPECPCPEGETSSGYHIYPDLGILEVVDPVTGEPRGDGQPGELVFTPLDARGSVVLRYRTGDVIDGGMFYEPCPHCGRRVPRLVGNISRTSEVRELRLEKLKGTFVDFNQLEHLLDNFEHIGSWQIELRKAGDDPLDVDELILHVHKADGVDDDVLRDALQERFAAGTEIHPNKIVFHSEAELRRMQGVGTQLKEQRVVDHRPRSATPAATAHE